MRAAGDKGDEGVVPGADDGEIVGGFVDGEEHGGEGAGIGGGEAHEAGRGADRDGAPQNSAIFDVDGDEARGRAVGDVHFGRIRIDDGAGGREAKKHGVSHLMRPGVDRLETVRVRRDDVEFAAVGLEEHLRGLAGEFEIGDEDGALEIDKGEARLRAAEDERDLAVGRDEYLVGLRDDRDRAEELERARVVDGESAGAAIDDGNVLAVGREASLDGFGGGVRAAVNLARVRVDGDELVGGGGGCVDAIAVGREVERIGCGANGYLRKLVGGRVENEDEAAGGGNAPDFVAPGVLAKVGDGWADRNFGDGLEFGEVDDGEGAVGGGDVSVHVEVGAEERGAVFAKKDDGGGDEKDEKNEIGAEVFGERHGMKAG